uniref:uncharacterized protein LOC120333193 n=1 Tax=Styela clava TaxID=7725 RepID=UPI0019398582|nr:uncharacterized protein LOC120333193 [Styela clava]
MDNKTSGTPENGTTEFKPIVKTWIMRILVVLIIAAAIGLPLMFVQTNRKNQSIIDEKEFIYKEQMDRINGLQEKLEELQTTYEASQNLTRKLKLAVDGIKCCNIE